MAFCDSIVTTYSMPRLFGIALIVYILLTLRPQIKQKTAGIALSNISVAMMALALGVYVIRLLVC